MASLTLLRLEPYGAISESSAIVTLTCRSLAISRRAARSVGSARAGLAASIKPGGYQDEVEIVANLSMPLAIFHGKEEQLVSEPYISKLTIPTLWRNEVQVITGAGHAPHWEQPERFNALLEAFIMP